MTPITTADELAETVGALRATGRIAVDTEADSLHCYQEKLCLIQICAPGFAGLVDPLADLDLGPLLAEFSGHELVLHGADYDLRLLRRVGFDDPGPVFDTMVAARLLGYRQFSLASLVEERFGVTLTKGSQKANWGRRPLPPKMLEYALNDIRYLLELAALLEERLHALGRWSWFTQSCQRLIEATRAERAKDGRELWRVPGGGNLVGRAAAVLRALWEWRDAEAERADRPPFHMMRNEDLIEWAKKLDATGQADPAHLRGGRRERFFAAAEVALALPADQWPRLDRQRRLRRTPEQERLLARLRSRRDAAATAFGLEASVIAPRSALEAVAADPAAAATILMPWQREIVLPD